MTKANRSFYFGGIGLSRMQDLIEDWNRTLGDLVGIKYWEANWVPISILSGTPLILRAESSC